MAIADRERLTQRNARERFPQLEIVIRIASVVILGVSAWTLLYYLALFLLRYIL